MARNYWADIAGPTWLYRLYAGQSLAYVGVSSDPASRFVAHRRKPWWREVTRVDLKWLPTRAEAFAAERDAIRREVPAYNIARPKGAAV